MKASSPRAGVVAMACTQEENARNTGSPIAWSVVTANLETGDGRTGRYGVAERPVLLRRPGNAGGGKGPWFKAGAGSGKAREIGATLSNSVDV